MELFCERGYDKTSLRQIAEQLGVTKAALYYHFRTKEDIVASLSEDLRRGIDEILEWAPSAPPGPDRAHEIVTRYGALLHDLGNEMMRFWAENQSAFRELGIGTGLRYQFRELADLIAGPDGGAMAIFHARQALLAVSWSLTMMGDLDMDDGERGSAATGIALAIVERMEREEL